MMMNLLLQHFIGEDMIEVDSQTVTNIEQLKTLILLLNLKRQETEN